MGTETSRRRFLGTLGLGMASVACAGRMYGKLFEAQKRPNILYIFTDDQRWDTLGCMGNKVVQSPNLDRLAAQGTVFENCFATTPVCGPSRASILSGQYARRHGVTDIEKLMDPGPWEKTYPALLKEHGYFIGYIGKFNVGTPEDVARWGSRYDFWGGWKYHGNYWHERICPNVTNDGMHDKTNNICTCPPEGEWPRVGHQGMKDPIHTTTEMVPIKVRQFLDGRDPNVPFCLTVGMKAPKDPWDDFPPELASMYEGVDMPIPVTATPEAAAQIPEILRKSLGSDAGLRYANDHKELAVRLRYYYRLVTALDSTIGKILGMLRQRGLAENTVIIFMSDNGYFVGDHGFWGKWTGYDPSIRVPCIVYDPRLPEDQRGKRQTEMVLNIDIAPTILNIAGVPIPGSVQGVDMTPLIEGRNVSWRDSWFFEHTWTADGRIEPSEGVRTKRWKYLRYPRQEPVFEQLFDLESDPLEIQNLADHKDKESTLGDLRALCERYVHDLQ